jgi:RNA polymerase subunit RPABC4/transcription elongation factor Spt4
VIRDGEGDVIRDGEGDVIRDGEGNAIRDGEESTGAPHRAAGVSFGRGVNSAPPQIGPMPSERTGSPSPPNACRECGRTLPQDANFCPGCGADLRAETDDAYCVECGSALAPDDEFCAECGAPRSATPRSEAPRSEAPRSETSGSEPTPRAGGGGGEAADEESYRAFRRRVQDHLADGWELTEDRGDRVVLVDREIGSVPVHVLLLLTTGGVGNLLYGWYHYSESAETRRLSVSDGPLPDGDLPPARGSDDPLVDLSGYLLGGLLLLIGLGVAAVAANQGALLGAAFGAAFALVGLALTPPAERRLNRRHGLSRFGRKRTVDHRVVRATERTESPCVVCGDPFERGVVRRRRDETVLAGVPVRTHAMERNHYCADCARAELFGGSAGTADDGAHRVKSTGDTGVTDDAASVDGVDIDDAETATDPARDA